MGRLDKGINTHQAVVFSSSSDCTQKHTNPPLGEFCYPVKSNELPSWHNLKHTVPHDQLMSFQVLYCLRLN